jgi:cardiolipin synthase
VLRHIPNTLTAFRLLAAPVLAWLLWYGDDRAAFGLFVLAGLSDAVDGYLAKRLAPGGRFGAWLDPAADKLLMLSAFLTLTLMPSHVTPLWLTVLVIARDIAIIASIALLRALAMPVVIAPLVIGKASTVVQVAYIGLTLLLLALHVDARLLTSALEVIVALVTAASWLAYGQVLVKAFALGRRTA